MEAWIGPSIKRLRRFGHIPIYRCKARAIAVWLVSKCRCIAVKAENIKNVNFSDPLDKLCRVRYNINELYTAQATSNEKTNPTGPACGVLSKRKGCDCLFYTERGTMLIREKQAK